MQKLVTMRSLLIITVKSILWHFVAPGEVIFNFSKHVTNVSFFDFPLHLGQTKHFSLSYYVTFNEESCCPVLTFGPIGPQRFHVSKDNCLEDDFANIVLLSGFHMLMPESIFHPKCEKKNNKYICKGIWSYHRPQSRPWEGTIAYRCFERKKLDIMVNLTFHVEKPQPCEPIQSQHCRDVLGYNMTIFPNIVGHQSQNQTEWIIDSGKNIVELKGESSLGCYQHFEKLACSIFLPNCVNGLQYTPCRQMCLEALEGCSDLINAFKQPISCHFLPDSMDPNVCYYEPVICNIPDNIEFGTLTYEGRRPYNITRYRCNKGYRLEGEAQRTCLYSGRWNGTAPSCVEILELKLTIILVPTITSIIILLSITAICVWKRQEIKIFIWDIQQRGHYEVNKERRKKLFLTYCTSDTATIDVFLPDLKREIPMWDITTFQEDFRPGKTIIGSIHDGVYKSDAMIALLTENYIQSEWCQYEFTQAKTRSATNPDFKCIVILQEGTDADFVESLPRPFHDYAKSRIYLTCGEVFFWRKLRYALHGIAAKMGP